MNPFTVPIAQTVKYIDFNLDIFLKFSDYLNYVIGKVLIFIPKTF